MGLIWALIRKFSFNVGREGGQSLSRERLLEFCAAETKNYPNVNIVDFDQRYFFHSLRNQIIED